MTRDKKEMRTLSLRHGKISFDDELDVAPEWREHGDMFDDSIAKFLETRKITEFDTAVYLSLIRNKFRERIMEPTNYATKQDLEDLRKNLTSLVEEKFLETKSPSDLSRFDQAIDLAVSRIQKLDKVTRLSCHTGNKSLDLYLRVQELSEDTLEKITKIEIEVSRRYPNISIELIPILTDEEIASGSHEIKMKQ